MSDLTFHKVSWDTFAKDCVFLAQKCKKLKIDRLLAISRGGLIVSRIMSDILKIPISHMTISSYQNAKQIKVPEITELPNTSFEGKSILIVDEVSDTGKTFERAIEHFKSVPVKNVLTASPYIKPHTKFTPDFWVENINAWILFPYDIRETADIFADMFQTKEKAREKMQKMGFAQWELDEVFNS